MRSVDRYDRYDHTITRARVTIDPPGIVAILGTTYTGAYYDVAGLDALVAAKNQATGWELGIHVDGASGGFVAPFLTPDRCVCVCVYVRACVCVCAAARARACS